MVQAFSHEAWQEWRKERNAALAADHGWLSLISFTWISEEPSHLSDFPGLWHVNNERLIASFTQSDLSSYSSTVLRNGEPFAGELEFYLHEGDSDFTLSSGTRVAEIAKRGGRYCVRVRDSLAPTRKAFEGVPTFPFNPEAVIEAHFNSYGEPLHYMGLTARKGVSASLTLVGDITFTYNGIECCLAVTGNPESNLTAVFYDETNGEETALWRSVTFAGPRNPKFLTDTSKSSSTNQGSCTIDFNRATNFPCAFTPFGTCPKPIDSNVIPIAVRAGETKPAAWIDPHASRE